MRLNERPSRRTEAHTSRSLFSTTASGMSPPFTSVSRSRSIVRRSRSEAPNTSSTSPCSSTLCRFCHRSSYDWYWKSGAFFPDPNLGCGMSGALGELVADDEGALAPAPAAAFARVTGSTALASAVEWAGAVAASAGPAASRAMANHDANDTAVPLVSGRERSARDGRGSPAAERRELQGARHRAATLRHPQMLAIPSGLGECAQGSLAQPCGVQLRALRGVSRTRT